MTEMLDYRLHYAVLASEDRVRIVRPDAAAPATRRERNARQPSNTRSRDRR